MTTFDGRMAHRDRTQYRRGWRPHPILRVLISRHIPTTNPGLQQPAILVAIHESYAYILLLPVQPTRLHNYILHVYVSLFLATVCM